MQINLLYTFVNKIKQYNILENEFNIWLKRTWFRLENTFSGKERDVYKTMVRNYRVLDTSLKIPKDYSLTTISISAVRSSKLNLK